MTLAHHDAAHRDEGSCADAEFFRTQHCGHDNVAACAQATVGAQHYTVAQIVESEDLVGFGQTHFPGDAGIFD